MINDNDKIKGYKTKKNRTIKLQTYADDTTIIIRNHNELKEIEKIYTTHERASEAKLNKEKTQILKLGNERVVEPEYFREKIKGKIFMYFYLFIYSFTYLFYLFYFIYLFISYKIF